MSPNIKIRHLPTDQFEDRPKGIEIDTLIIHSMHNPEAKNRFSALSCKECLDKHGVSSHYLIDLSGTAWQLIPENKKAWHAGISTMPEDGREGVNAFSIGIELIGSEDTDFTEAQYQALALLTKDILSRHSIQYIYGHYDIAPGRKTDPWGLDWLRYREDVLRSCAYADLRFSPTAATASTEDKKNSCGQPPCPLCSQAPA
ncbi:AmpD protein [Candidatus Electrothrix marina]|uniref:1,6-anhydro-N-acetylmuramyl-L-alanine amidase AmpD n=2 Tax=Candidatus Electrothrix marina TaxID=1859130 RepID=A0A3S3SUM2_9BACT|nr:AmpD protein [Candidatus Electrothrix marina]